MSANERLNAQNVDLTRNCTVCSSSWVRTGCGTTRAEAVVLARFAGFVDGQSFSDTQPAPAGVGVHIVNTRPVSRWWWRRRRVGRSTCTAVCGMRGRR